MTGKIARPDAYEDRPDRGTVVKIAEDCPLHVGIGDTALFHRRAGQERRFGEYTIVVLLPHEVDGKIAKDFDVLSS